MHQQESEEGLGLRQRSQSGPNELGYAGCAGLSAAELGPHGVVIIDVMNVRGQVRSAAAALVQLELIGLMMAMVVWLRPRRCGGVLRHRRVLGARKQSPGAGTTGCRSWPGAGEYLVSQLPNNNPCIRILEIISHHSC